VDYDQEKEKFEREEKKKLFAVLTQDNSIGTVETRQIFERYRSVTKGDSRRCSQRSLGQ
jgi:hypothetical protein